MRTPQGELCPRESRPRRPGGLVPEPSVDTDSPLHGHLWEKHCRTCVRNSRPVTSCHPPLLLKSTASRPLPCGASGYPRRGTETNMASIRHRTVDESRRRPVRIARLPGHPSVHRQSDRGCTAPGAAVGPIAVMTDSGEDALRETRGRSADVSVASARPEGSRWHPRELAEVRGEV
jgi:hypothetical protein